MRSKVSIFIHFNQFKFFAIKTNENVHIYENNMNRPLAHPSCSNKVKLYK